MIVRDTKETDMTTRYINRLEDTDNRQTRVQLPKQMQATFFQGWGPKF
jgi:hypothetical protein